MAELSVSTHGGKGRAAEILLVDDNPGDAILTKKAFSALKFTNNITVADDAEKAMIHLKSDLTKPDLILLDINMPKKGGIFLLEEIKQDQNLRNIPVLMLTSSKVSTDIMASSRLDANSYIVKPLTMEKLGIAIARIPNFWAVLLVSEE